MDERDRTATLGDFGRRRGHTLIAYEHRIFFTITGPLVWPDENGRYFDAHSNIALAGPL